MTAEKTEKKKGGFSSLKTWLKVNRASITMSVISFLLATGFNQGIDWYKSSSDSDNIISALRFENQTNISNLEGFNQQHTVFLNVKNCNNLAMNDNTTRDLATVPMLLASDFYMMNTDKVAALDSGLVSEVRKSYSLQQDLMRMGTTLYTQQSVAQKLQHEAMTYKKYCEYVISLQSLRRKLAQ